MSDSAKRIERYVDPAMFTAETVDVAAGPKVYLLEMTQDPLGSIAALSAMYTGKVTRNKAQVTDAERDHHLREMQLTKLTTPLESVNLHFMIEGVTRAFTHQLVRGRVSAYAQESMRFAVKEDMPVALPPSLAGTINEEEWKAAVYEDYGDDADLAPSFDRESDKQKMRIIWDRNVAGTRRDYNHLISLGMPAEDARGLAPTNVMTRINWTTNLRNLIDVLGNRLCTQAQFEWRSVATQIAQSIAMRYREDMRNIDAQESLARNVNRKENAERIERVRVEYRAIASLFRPICYRTGKCEFNSDADRACSIRDRVEQNHKAGRPSSEWATQGVGPDHDGTLVQIQPIRSAEWLFDPTAAR